MASTLMSSSAAMVLPAVRVRDVMTPQLISLSQNASIEQATVFLTDRGFSATVVIDEAGHPVGVLSKSDLLIHSRETIAHGESGLISPNAVTVREVMTPVVFTIPQDAPIELLVEQMVQLNVHRMFVVDENEVLVGVVTSMDILRALRT